MTAADILKRTGIHPGKAMGTIKCLRRLASTVIVAASLHSCSLNSGSWEDDPGNWGRAFDGQTKPPEIKVIHSKYLRTPHFSYEAEYFFQIECPREFIDDWIRQDSLMLTPPVDDRSLDDPRRPAWFMPGSFLNYEIWMSDSNSGDRFRIYRERSTGMAFLTNSTI